MINILIVDDFQIVRDVLKRTILDETDMQVVCEAANAKDAFELLIDNNIDVVLMDINMPELNGIEATKIIKKKNPELPILMVSALSEKIYASKSIKAGASGFVSKENAFDELCEAIRIVKDGGVYMSPTINDCLV